jgi:transketolase C-terminal domain/subunit
MQTNKDIYIIFCGLGWPRVDEFLKAYPGRALNGEASEQMCLDMAVGLAYEGKIPFVYTISPFLYRGWETLRTYYDHENLFVIVIAAGRNEEYSQHDGFSHSASDIPTMFNTLKNFHQYYPDNKNELEEAINKTVLEKKPALINIHK